MGEKIDFFVRLIIVCGCFAFSVFVFQKLQIPIEIKEMPQLGTVGRGLVIAYCFPIFFAGISLSAIRFKELLQGR